MKVYKIIEILNKIRNNTETIRKLLKTIKS